MEQGHTLSNNLVVIGNIGAPFGIKGWLKMYSYTDPQENILNFNEWYLVEPEKVNKPKVKTVKVKEIKKFNDQFLVLFNDILDRNNAALLTNKQVAVNRHDLPELPVGQYYWADLIGAEVYNLSGQILGFLDHVFYTGANDVMVVKKNNTPNTNKLAINNSSYLIPYKSKEFVVDIDLLNKKLIVNWDV